MKIKTYRCEAYIYDVHGEEHFVESTLEADSRREAMCALMIIRENNKFLVDESWVEGSMLIDVRRTRELNR